MTLQTLLDEVRQGTLIPSEMFIRDDLNDILDERDQSDFEQPWLECSERIKTAWQATTIDDLIKKLVDEIRKESFLVVSRATQQHEISSYVSDDFELICKAIALDLNDPYASGLLNSYHAGEIPK